VTRLRFTLVSDGSSDRALLPVLRWLLTVRHRIPRAVEPRWADLRRLVTPPQGLVDRLRKSLHLYPCDLLFIHRDAEAEPQEARRTEILDAIATADVATPAVCVVPIRMQEAWLLFDEAALRTAAGNPNGRSDLRLPPLHRLEALPDPKAVLHETLQLASGLRGRRLRRFRAAERAQRVTELIDDFSPLLELHAFRLLDHDVGEVLAARQWS
jgi:hypothetical protein